MKTDQSAVLESLRKTRSIQDVVQIVRAIARDVRACKFTAAATTGPAPLTSSLSATQKIGGGEITIDHSRTQTVPQRVSVKSPTATNTQLGVKLLKFVVPPKAAVEKHSAVISKLHDNAVELEAAEALVNQAFKGAKNQRQVLSAIHDLREEIDTSLARAFTALNAIADKHLPEEMGSLSDTLVAYLIDHVNPKFYKNIGKEVYVTFDQDLTVFSLYVVINELQASTGFVYDEFYVILTGTINSSGIIHYYLNTMPDFKIPGHFPIGKEVKNTADLTIRVSTLIAHNDIASDFDRKPMPIDTRRIKSGGMTSIPNVEDAYVADDSLYVVVRKGKDTRKNLVDVQTQVIPLLNQLTHNKRGTKGSIQVKTGSRDGLTVLQFIFTPSGDHKVHTLNLDRLNEVQSMFDFSEQEVHALKQILLHK